MRKFFLEGFFFCLPLTLLFLFIFCIDPYNFFNVSKLVNNDTKVVAINRSNDVEPRGNMLWKVLQFNRKPCPNVVIGNSQGFSIREDLITKITGDEYYNFCVPGASLSTTITTFWYMIKKTKPEKVYLQVSFALSNATEKRTYDLFHFAKDYIDKPYLYFFNKDIFLDSYYNLKYEIKKDKNTARHIPRLKPGIKDEISEAELNEVFQTYLYPEKNMLELKRIAAYCRENNIQLEFIIFPCYRRVDEYLSEKGLIEMRDRFRNEINALGKTHDFLTISSINDKETNFIDYFHQTQHITDSLTSLIWQDKKQTGSLNLK